MGSTPTPASCTHPNSEIVVFLNMLAEIVYASVIRATTGHARSPYLVAPRSHADSQEPAGNVDVPMGHPGSTDRS
jgi:hypothetical protein